MSWNRTAKAPLYPRSNDKGNSNDNGNGKDKDKDKGAMQVSPLRRQERPPPVEMTIFEVGLGKAGNGGSQVRFLR
jgi:hypothetical protein